MVGLLSKACNEGHLILLHFDKLHTIDGAPKLYLRLYTLLQDFEVKEEH